MIRGDASDIMIREGDEEEYDDADLDFDGIRPIRAMSGESFATTSTYGGDGDRNVTGVLYNVSVNGKLVAMEETSGIKNMFQNLLFVLLLLIFFLTKRFMYVCVSQVIQYTH